MIRSLPLLPLLLAGCSLGAAPEPAAAPRPAMWTLADSDTTIYLLGTIHALPRGTEWRTPAIANAVARSSELVLEVADIDGGDAPALLRALGTGSGQPPLAQRVPADKRARLAALIEGSGLPAQAFDAMDSWAAALVLMAVQMQAIGLAPGSGVDAALEADFEVADKPVSGLETAAQQLGFFDALPESEQRLLLASVIDDSADWPAEFATMLRAWKAGDTQAIAASFDDEIKAMPALHDAIFRRRNAAWTAWLAKRLDKPGTILVAVGAGHLAGAESVPAMLEARGLKVTRAQ